MTPVEKRTLRAVVAVLLSPRDRLGRLEVSPEARDQLRECVHFEHIPHGGRDMADQCAMVLQALIGERRIRSASDPKAAA